MKKKIPFAAIAMSLFVLMNANAQQQFNESDLSNFLQAEKNDASKLIGAYVSPVIKGVSYAMTSGWYHTGKTHNKLGVDLGVTINTVILPTSEQTFNPQQLGLSSNTTTTATAAPTFIGPKTSTTYSVKYNAALPAVSLNGPEGLDFKGSIGGNYIPVPMYQLGIGLIKSTDLKIRFLPEVKKGDSRIKMLGFGLMHDVKQHIPGIKMLPFDLSILVAYNSVSGATSLANKDQTNDGKPYSSNGSVSYDLSSWVGQAIISKKVAVLTFYAGIGYGAVKTNVKITGSYTLDPYNSVPPITITDPFSTSYSNNSVKFTTGMRLKLGPVYFNGDYTVQKYNSITVGLGASIR